MVISYAPESLVTVPDGRSRYQDADDDQDGE